MTPRIAIIGLCLLTACSQEPAGLDREGEPLFTSFSDTDPEMNEAMAQARASLPDFEARLRNPPGSQSHLALKARFEEGGEIEHLWINDVEIVSDGYRGTLGNEPVHVTSVQYGDLVTLPRDRVSDWMAIDDDTLVGGYTLRVHRARMPAGQRVEFDANAGFRID